MRELEYNETTPDAPGAKGTDDTDAAEPQSEDKTEDDNQNKERSMADSMEDEDDRIQQEGFNCCGISLQA